MKDADKINGAVLKADEEIKTLKEKVETYKAAASKANSEKETFIKDADKINATILKQSQENKTLKQTL